MYEQFSVTVYVNSHLPVLLQDKQLCSVYKILSCFHLSRLCVQNLGGRFE